MTAFEGVFVGLVIGVLIRAAVVLYLVIRRDNHAGTEHHEGNDPGAD